MICKLLTNKWSPEPHNQFYCLFKLATGLWSAAYVSESEGYGVKLGVRHSRHLVLLLSNN